MLVNPYKPVILFMGHRQTEKKTHQKWGAAKQGVSSEAVLFCSTNISWTNEIKMKKYPRCPNNENGLVQMIRMGFLIRHKCVDQFYEFVYYFYVIAAIDSRNFRHVNFELILFIRSLLL